MANASASDYPLFSQPLPEAARACQQWRQRPDTENFQRNLDFLKRHALPATQLTKAACTTAQWVFSHVPKTAGTTLESILAKNVPLKDTLRINAPVLNGCPCSYGANGRHPLLCMGHHPMHSLIYQLLPEAPVFHFSLIRHPLARVVSWFNYLKSHAGHALHARVKDMDLDEFLDQPDLVETRNGQCRRFAGWLHQPDTPADAILLQQAKEVIEGGFSFVGTTERFDESVLILHKLLGLTDIYYRRLNQSEKTLPVDELSPTQRDRILTMNRADADLHDWVSQRLETQISTLLAKDALERFQKTNQRWHALLNTIY